MARDAILFFIAFEVVLVPMWVLVRRFGDDHVPDETRADAAGRFVLFTVLGSTLMLVGILFLVHHQGTSDLTVLADRHGAGLSPPLQVAIAAILLLGLGIKVPLWPLHTWLPSAHTIAPTAGSVLLAAVLLKMGTYGIVRLAVATVPEGVAALSPVLAILGVVGILWGGLACLVERDLKRLIAYSSVAHMGFVALAIASGSETGTAGGALRQHRARRRRGPALLRRRRPQGAVGVVRPPRRPGRPARQGSPLRPRPRRRPRGRARAAGPRQLLG